MSFLWLEFSQSFQVLAILLTTLVYSVVYGYRFWTAIGLPSACFPFVVNCQIVLLSCNLVCHFGVLLLHFIKGGCNGIGAWVLNSVLNGAILFLFLNFYVKKHLRKTEVGGGGGDELRFVAEKLELVKDKDI
ncbi:UNVERIFIED_CONTAM: Elongation of fatty acids protein 3-like [Sesamum radiatum]|uniref:Elongation of fatty acids protein 3-like n=1 Tax=Sesamum radiatum TaxID=300843 RepID=A0AAW2RCB4_SESRA